MSSYFDEASLVMIPSGYKNQKVYSIKPLSGDGDLTFSRASSATRVASNGLIEKVRTNLALYSEQFNNAAWSTNGASATPNTVANPLTGAVTADTLVADNGNNFHYIAQNITYVAGEATISIYAKAAGYTWFVVDTGFTNAFSYFNLTTGALGTKGSACTAAITSVGNGWYRCSVTFTSTASAASLFLSIRNADNGGAFTGDGVSGFYIYGVQAEQGVATDYIATTSAAVSVGPVSGLPRLDYLNSTCPRLLLEPQRTNQILQSEAFGSASWAAFNASISSNVSATLDPQGYYGADKLVEDSSSAFHDADQVQTYTAAAYTISVFAKAAGRNHIFLQQFDGTTFFTSGTFNLANGTVSGSGSIVSYGNGWYRCSFTATTASGTGKAYINLSNGTTGNYQGNGTSGVYLWGCQVEAGAYATSYIPTLGTSVTRVADAASKTGISSLIGQTAGTLFIDYNLISASQDIVVMTALGLPDNDIAIIFIGSQLQIYAYNNFVEQFRFQLSGYKNTNRTKIAVAYANNDVVLYINGNLIGTDTSSSLNITNKISYTSADYNAHKINQSIVFKTRLTNAQLAELTTL